MLIHGGPCNCYLTKVLGAPWVHKASESLTRELLSQILQEEKNHMWTAKPSLTCCHTQNHNRISLVCLRTVLCTHIKSSFKEEPGIHDSSSETIPKGLDVTDELHSARGFVGCCAYCHQRGVEQNPLLQDVSEGRLGRDFPPLLTPQYR